MTEPFRKDNLEIQDPSQYLSPEQSESFDALRTRMEKAEKLTGDDLQEYKELEEILVREHNRAVIDLELGTVTAEHPLHRFEEVVVDIRPGDGQGQARNGIKAWIHKKADKQGLFRLLLPNRHNALQVNAQDEVTVWRSSRFRISHADRDCQLYTDKYGPHDDVLLNPDSSEGICIARACLSKIPLCGISKMGTMTCAF